jgi:hypothetical protein
MCLTYSVRDALYNTAIKVKLNNFQQQCFKFVKAVYALCEYVKSITMIW